MKLIFPIVILGFLVKIFNFPSSMPFLQDQGWFLISARDLLINGDIPLVGITSSHTWLHQGPIWIYVQAILMKVFGFNPAIGGYFVIIFSTVSIFVLYLILKEMFSKRIALISSFLYATSPLVVFHSRMNYHTSPIPLLTMLLFYSVYKWVRGDVKYFPAVVLLTALLYNFELATFVLMPIVLGFLSFGLIKKKEFATRLLNFKTFFLSLVAFVVPMIPFLVYDLRNGFPQTFKFAAWVGYKLLVFLGYPALNPNAPGETWTTFFTHFTIVLKRILFLNSFEISILLLISSIFVVSYRVYKKREVSIIILFTYLIVSLLGYIVAKTNSEAYLLITFPLIFAAIGILFDFILSKKILLIPGLFAILSIGIFNINHLMNSNYLSYENGYGPPYIDKLNVSKEIIKEAGKRPYNIVGVGWGSQYESFTSTYEFLLWWQGSAPSENDEKLKFYIEELPGKIKLEKK